MSTITDQDLIELLEQAAGLRDEEGLEDGNYHAGPLGAQARVETGRTALVGANLDPYYDLPVNLDRLRDGVERLAARTAPKP